MDSLIERLKAAIDETERIASFALRYRNAYLEQGKIEAWEAKRYVNNHTPPFYDYWVVESRLGSWGPKQVIRFDGFAAEIDARFFASGGAPTVLRQVAADRELIDDCVEVIGDANMSGYGQFGWLKDHPNALAVTLAVETIRNRAEAYGITVEVTA